MVTAESADLADEVIGAVRRAVPPAQRTDGKARLTLWTVGSGGSPNRHRRWVDTPPWDAISANYPGEVGAALGRLVGLTEPPEHGGRLLLWYGEPGTGKTTAIRSLGHEWRQWADLHFVLDPEAFFGSPEYLMHVVADEDLWDPRAMTPAAGSCWWSRTPTSSSGPTPGSMPARRWAGCSTSPTGSSGTACGSSS